MVDGFDLASIPQAVNDALFNGSNLIAAQLLLTAVIMFTALLPMLVARMRPDMIIVVMAMVVLVCSAIGWLDQTITMVMLLIIAASLAKTVATSMRG
jgi:hypothetical protein